MTLKLNGTTSGSVSLDAPATGSNISFTLPGSVGTSGQLLSTDGSGVLSFVNGGKILQVVQATDTSKRSTTSTSFTDVTGVSVTITPVSASSSVIILVTGLLSLVNPSATASRYGEVQITTSANATVSGAERCLVGLINLTGTSTNVEQYYSLFLSGRAVPGSTAAVTYKMRFKSSASDITTAMENGTNTARIYAIEVAA